MLQSDSVINTIQLPTYTTYRILSKSTQRSTTKATVMIAINAKEEQEIDDIGRSTLTFKRGNKTFHVQMKDIYCYGEVDFNDADTLKEIEEFNFLNHLLGTGSHVVSNYDYDTHSCTSPNRYCKWVESWSPAKVAKMAHGYLNKPERILLFTHTLKK